jgi:hypothetical protein
MVTRVELIICGPDDDMIPFEIWINFVCWEHELVRGGCSAERSALNGLAWIDERWVIRKG